MGCIICNLLEIWSRELDYEECIKCVNVEGTDEIEGLRAELVNEICNDIATQHPEMVKRINEIVRLKCGIPTSFLIKEEVDRLHDEFIERLLGNKTRVRTPRPG